VDDVVAKRPRLETFEAKETVDHMVESIARGSSGVSENQRLAEALVGKRSV
jgi:hypothetical protein